MCNVKIFSLFRKYISSLLSSYTRAYAWLVLYQARLFTSLFTNKFFCSGLACLINKPKTKAQLGLFINKQTWMSFLSSWARVVHNRLGSFTALLVITKTHIPLVPSSMNNQKEIVMFPHSTRSSPSNKPFI